MNLIFSKRAFDELPFRDDEPGEYVDGKIYRARAYPKLIFRRRGNNWDAFVFKLTDGPPADR